jgi:hypothetical protein
MVGGVMKSPSGKYMLGPDGDVVRVGTYVAPAGERSVSPSTVTVNNSITPGTEIATLVFSGYPAPQSQTSPFTAEFTNEFSGVSRTVTLTNNAGGRVALTGSWDAGYRLVAGSTAMVAGSYTISLQVSGFPETLSIAMTVEAPADTGAILFTAKVENFDTVASWTDQEMSIAQWFRKGDVPPGSVAVMTVDGVRIAQQVSNRTSWDDGSLKLAQVRFLMPAIAAGVVKTVTWQRAGGSWTANDTALHTSTAAITSKVALEYSFTSFKGRNASNVLTAERGPKRFRSADMLAAANSSWIEQIVAGPVCCEWRASDMATLANGTSKDPNLGCLLYVRAWGGTAGNPKRIQFLYRSVYGWSTDVAADEQGIRVDLDLKVNNTTIRGAANGTTGWGAVNSWKGGFLVSAGAEGTMDWFDVATNAYVTPPKLIYRHDVVYGVQAKFVPPYDTSNAAFSMTPPVWTYLPARRGPLRPMQDDVADHEMITWTTAKPMARCIAAHARATAQQLSDFQRYARVAGFGMGAMTGVGLHRTTRKIVCHLPPVKSTNQTALGGSVYVPDTSPLYKIANADATLRWPNGGSAPEIANLDASHFPQMNLWPYISEGDQHWLDLQYHEATLPGLFEAPAYGFYGTSGRAGIPFGGISFYGQIRGVGHSVRPVAVAVGAGNPGDPHWVMCRDYLDHWSEMTEEVPLEEDAWRGGIDRTDGRRFQDLKLLKPNNEPCYKLWMHTFGLHSTAYGYGISEYPRLKSRADWFAYAPTVIGGGWKNDTNDLLKPDPFEAGDYTAIYMSSGTGATIEDRRAWHYVQWKTGASVCTYKADNQTLTFTGPMQGTTAMENGMIITVTGIRDSTEPFNVNDMTKIPGLLTRNIPYYAVQSSGNTCKISLSPGGSPVTFSAGGADIVGAAVRTSVNGKNTVRTGADFSSPAANDYYLQVLAALDVYQHYVAPNDQRVLLARRSILALKAGTTIPNSWDERAKMSVPS